MDRTADAVIIGGGIMGASVGHFLARRGFGRVVLLEKRSLAAVSTGHSAANVRCSYSNPVTVALALRAFEMFEHDRDELGGPTGFRRTGQVILFGDAHVEIGRQVLESERAHDTGTREIGVDEIRELAPQFDLEGVVMGTYQARSGYADPVLTTRTLVEEAKDRQLVAYEGVGARGIRTESGRVAGVETDDGEIATHVVVNAAGPWGGRIGNSAGVTSSVQWSRESDLILRLPENFGTFPIVADPACHIYFRPQGDGSLLAGLDYPKPVEPLNIDDYDPNLDAATRGKIEDGLHRRAPALRDAEFERGWASIYTITDDWHPLVGSEPDVEGLYSCYGGSGHGFKLGPPIGESLAQIIAGEKPGIDLHPLRPTRFAEGEPFTSPWGAGNRG